MSGNVSPELITVGTMKRPMVSKTCREQFPPLNGWLPKKIRFSNFFSQDSLMFVGARHGFELLLDGYQRRARAYRRVNPLGILTVYQLLVFAAE